MTAFFILYPFLLKNGTPHTYVVTLFWQKVLHWNFMKARKTMLARCSYVGNIINVNNVYNISDCVNRLIWTTYLTVYMFHIISMTWKMLYSHWTKMWTPATLLTVCHVPTSLYATAVYMGFYIIAIQYLSSVINLSPYS